MASISGLAEATGEGDEDEEEEEEECGGDARRPIPVELAWLIYAMVAITKWVKRGHLRYVGVDDDGLPAYDPHTYAPHHHRHHPRHQSMTVRLHGPRFSIKLGEETVRIEFPTSDDPYDPYSPAAAAAPATAGGPDSTTAAAAPPLPVAGMQRCAMCAKQAKVSNNATTQRYGTLTAECR
jgi:hypothetical protein